MGKVHSGIIVSFKQYDIMKLQLFASVFIIFFAVCKRNPNNNQLVNSKSGISDSLRSKLDSYLSSYVDSGFSGVALVADSNGIIFHKAYNGKDDQVDTNTAFYIASTRKSFVAEAIMQLQEKGKLSVLDSLGKFFDQVPADKKGITIHNLLTHTSGLDYCECTDGETDRERIIKSILALRLKNHIGEKWSYQNENYYLLEFIVAQISGITFRDYIKENILKPVGMMHTGFWGYENEVQVEIAPLNDSLKSMPLYKKEFKDGKPRPVLVGGMFSTSTDLYKWTEAIRQRKGLSDSSLVASFKPYKQAVIHDVNDTAMYYSYGWIPTMVKNKRINVFCTGREDWMMNNRIYMLDNGITILVWSLDKKGPDSDAMATVLSSGMMKIFQN
jgi:CubicO group peptidase (beta-lactamase class C family)